MLDNFQPLRSLDVKWLIIEFLLFILNDFVSFLEQQLQLLQQPQQLLHQRQRQLGVQQQCHQQPHHQSHQYQAANSSNDPETLWFSNVRLKSTIQGNICIKLEYKLTFMDSKLIINNAIQFLETTLKVTPFFYLSLIMP